MKTKPHFWMAGTLPAGAFSAQPRNAKTNFLSLLLILFCLFGFSARGQGQAQMRFQIKSAVLGEERNILVRLPAGYDQGSESYQVLYMTDGDAHMTHTSATIEFLARNGRIPELIVVGIPNTDRTRDLTPTVESPGSGGADNFLKFIETELIPYVEGHYRTNPYRIFAGHSLGGLLAVHALLARTDLFNAFIAVSPSLQWDHEVELKRAQEFFKDRKELNKTLFVSLGNEQGGILHGFEGFKELLGKNKPKGFHTEVQRLTDEDHGSVVLRSHYMGLRKIFEDWQIPRDPESGAVTGGLRGAEEHYKKLSERFGYTLQMPENLVNDLGYEFLFARKTQEAIAALEMNVKMYPDSANVYDSLAEAQEKSGRRDLAGPNYQKAFTIAKEKNHPSLAAYKTNFERVVVNDADRYFEEKNATGPDGKIASRAPQSITRNIIQDKNGNLWFASWQGIIRYDGKDFTNFTLQAGLRKFHVFSLLEDSKGNLWFGTIGAGVYRFDGKNFINFTPKEGLGNDRVAAIFEDRSGHIWFGTPGGASRFDGTAFTNFTTQDCPSLDDCASIAQDKTGKIWFATWAGACFYDGKTFTAFKKADGKPFKNVRSIIEDRAGKLWIGGEEGLFLFDGKTLTQISHQFIGYIYEARSGKVWISASKGDSKADWGLYRVDGKKLTTVKENDGKVDGHQVFGILEDKAGNILFGTEKGAVRYDGRRSFANLAD